MIAPKYLGDGVYASFDGFHIVLHANSHPNPVIYLDDIVQKNLVAYIEKVKTLSDPSNEPTP